LANVALNEEERHSQIKGIEPTLLLAATTRKRNIKWLTPFCHFDHLPRRLRDRWLRNIRRAA
jgi:hypothetical protein